MRDEKYAEVLKSLEDWKSPQEIARLHNLWIATTYYVLNRLERRGLIEKRWRTISAERLKVRGGNREAEYKLHATKP